MHIYTFICVHVGLHTIYTYTYTHIPIYTYTNFLAIPQNQTYNDIMRAVPGFFLVCTADGKLVYISENITDFLGHSMVCSLYLSIYLYPVRCGLLPYVCMLEFTIFIYIYRWSYIPYYSSMMHKRASSSHHLLS